MPKGDRRMGTNPHANGGLLTRDLRLPDMNDHAVSGDAPGAGMAESTRVLGGYLRDVFRLNADTRDFRMFGPDETASNRLEARIRSDEQDVGSGGAARRRLPRGRRTGHGDAQRDDTARAGSRVTS